MTHIDQTCWLLQIFRHDLTQLLWFLFLFLCSQHLATWIHISTLALNIRPCGLACVCNNNMRHLVTCGAWIFSSADVTLFLQLCKTSGKRRTDIPHVFFSFCDSVCSNCLHPSSCFSHIFHCLPPPSISCPSPPSPSLSPSLSTVSPSQTWLITWPWMTSPSRSSCWPLGWPQPALEASRHLQLHSGGAAWSWHSLWRLLCSCPVLTDQCTRAHTLPSPLYLTVQYKLCGTWKINFLEWSSGFWCKFASVIKGSMNNKSSMFLFICFEQELGLFDEKSLLNLLKHTR